MSDKYYKYVAKKIMFYIKNNSKYEDIEHIIYITLKEVARDQRYACVDAVRYPNITGMLTHKENTKLQTAIQNAEIDGVVI